MVFVEKLYHTQENSAGGCNPPCAVEDGERACAGARSRHILPGAAATFCSEPERERRSRDSFLDAEIRAVFVPNM